MRIYSYNEFRLVMSNLPIHLESSINNYLIYSNRVKDKRIIITCKSKENGVNNIVIINVEVLLTATLQHNEILYRLELDGNVMTTNSFFMILSKIEKLVDWYSVKILNSDWYLSK